MSPQSAPLTTPAAPGAARRPDASMDLLTNLRVHAVDPGYAAAEPRRRRPLVVGASLLLAGLLFGVAFANTLRTAPASARERAELISRIQVAEADQDALRTRSLVLTGEVRALERATGGLSAAEDDLRDVLSVQVGAVAVRGPGLVVTIDDGADADVRGSRVVDIDLRMAVNSLWAGGAEAVSVNGHRLSSRTPIRNAGDAITVDYRSLLRPYVVEAIGDSGALEAAFRDSEGGQWLTGLSQHYGVSVQVGRSGELNLPADPGLGVDRARPAR